LIEKEHLDRKEFEQLMANEPPADWQPRDWDNEEQVAEPPQSKFADPSAPKDDPAPAPAG